MWDVPDNISTIDSVDKTAAEFLRAQEVKVPETIDELRQATESASAEVEQLFGKFDELRAMKEGDGAEEIPSLESYDEWIDAVLDLDAAFLDECDGALGKELIQFAALDDAAFEARQDEAQRLLQQTGNIALRIYPSIHRLVTLGFGRSRNTVLEKLSAGDLVRQERVHDVSFTPRRKSIIGMLRDLDARLPEDKRTNVWTLDVAPELPPVIVVSNPFQPHDDDLAGYWRQRIGVARSVYGRDATVLSLSGDKTMAVLWELENIAKYTADDELRRAVDWVAEWLEGKRVYYQDPDPRDFELYHFGMEDPATLMELMRSLDSIKHFDPELFFEFLGIEPSLGGRSSYFGSFLHKAMYNTQRAVDTATPELGVMAIQTMMKQLLTVDDSVQTYAAVVSQESLKAMASEIKSTVEKAPTPESRAQAFTIMAVPYSRIAIDAEVRRQLDALREASPENIFNELHRRIDDIEHPLKLAEYIGLLPRSAEQDVRVVKELRNVFGDIRFDAIREQCQKRRPEYLNMLYDRIPLIDETREDLGFALRIRVALRDAMTMTNFQEEIIIKSDSEKTRARQFSSAILGEVFREDFEAIQDQFGVIDRQIIRRSIATGFRCRGNAMSLRDHLMIHQDRFSRLRSKADQAFYIGQIVVEAAQGMNADTFFRHTSSNLPFTNVKEYPVDLIFLSVIGHPQGKEAAFKYFDMFCELIPAERMAKLLMLPMLSPSRRREFFAQFQEIPLGITRVYLEYLVARNPDFYREGSWCFGSRHLDDLRKIHRVIFSKKTPWTLKIEMSKWTKHGSMGHVRRDIDVWEIWGLLGKTGLTPEAIDAKDPEKRINLIEAVEAADDGQPNERWDDSELGALAQRFCNYLEIPYDRNEITKHLIRDYLRNKRDSGKDYI